MKIDTRLLTSMLKRTQRIQCVAGKPQAQVTACVLTVVGDLVSTTSIVRDGKTSLSRFNAPVENSLGGQTILPVPDIDRVLGVLSAHSSPVKIEFKDDRLIFKSGKKTTRLVSSLNGLAFPHSSETLTAWGQKSQSLSESFLFDDKEGFVGYKMQSKEVRTPCYCWTVDANELFEALRCDNMNGQKLNRYTFAVSDDTIRVGVGEEMKGLTYTTFTNESGEKGQFEWTFEGGLENVLSGLSGNITLNFIDFRSETQGIRMVIDLGERGYVYQAGVLV
tara:strand:+ start:10267 stop:11097 length:831 start_codon:yes stop_codon:yes gene_type:complete